MAYFLINYQATIFSPFYHYKIDGLEVRDIEKTPYIYKGYFEKKNIYPTKINYPRNLSKMNRKRKFNKINFPNSLTFVTRTIHHAAS